MIVRLTVKEIIRAARWAEEHNYNVHGDKLEWADIHIRNLPDGHIVGRTVVICEACERVKVRNTNFLDITDYDCA